MCVCAATSADGSATLWDCGRGQKLYNIATLSCEINKCHMTTDSNHGNQSAGGCGHGGGRGH